jgi:hypothetical protein
MHAGCCGTYRRVVEAVRGQRRSRIGILLAAALVAGCTASTGGGANAPTPRTPQLVPPADPASVVAADRAVPLAAATSAALYRDAPVVVLAADGDASGQAGAASAAVALGAPMLLTPAAGADPADGTAVTDEVRRLGPETLLAVGAGARDWAGPNGGGVPVVSADGALANVVGAKQAAPRSVDAAGLTAAVATLDRAHPELLTVGGGSAPPPAPANGDRPELPATVPPAPREDLVVLARVGAEQVAAVATARAAGARVRVLDVPDPRADGELVTQLAGAPDAPVLALGSAFGPAERFRQRLAVARTGVQLPGGGQLALAGRRMIALYGNPTIASLGSLGEQGLDASVARVKELAASYDAASDLPVVPAFEIITTVASTTPGSDGNYSSETEIGGLRPYVDAAKAAGIYVVLDLQPGRTDFLTQAKRYEELLAEPHVGLALDPEWRLKPNQRHLTQIGTVGVNEINGVIDWLANLARERSLPQKIVLLHQFRTAMIIDRARVDTTRDEIVVMIHADGFGTTDMKLSTWNALRTDPPPGAVWGWKNFIDEDRPMLTPEQTLGVSDDIVYVSYQ